MRRVRGVVVAVVIAGCGDDGAPASGSTTSGADGSGTTFATSLGETSLGSGGASSGSSDGGGMGGKCSLYEQDCNDGEKCMPWSEEADLTPDDIRCCPLDANPAQVGDQCVVQDYFGSCLDNCAEGSLCLDTDDDGFGVCQAFCGGTPDTPMCGADENCFIYFAGVPLCFERCNPLVQECPDGLGCYPDADAAGGTDFVCFPVVGGQDLLDGCWLLSNCSPGLICVTPDFLPPGCNGIIGCCTQLCDITEPDVCGDIDPALQCISWYYGGAVPPSVELENVGACALPPN